MFSLGFLRFVRFILAFLVSWNIFVLLSYLVLFIHNNFSVGTFNTIYLLLEFAFNLTLLFIVNNYIGLLKEE